MKALVGAFNQEKALVGAFSVIVKTNCGTDGSFYSTSLGEVVDVDHEDPLVPEVQRFAGEDDLLSPGAELLIACAGEELSCPDQITPIVFTDSRASVIEHLLEQSRAHGRVFCQQ